MCDVVVSVIMKMCDAGPLDNMQL